MQDAWLQQYLRMYRSASIGYFFIQSYTFISNSYAHYVSSLHKFSKETGDVFAVSQGVYMNWTTSGQNIGSIKDYQEEPGDPHPNHVSHFIMTDVVLNQLALAILEACRHTKQLLLTSSTTIDYHHTQTTALSYFDSGRSSVLPSLRYKNDDVFFTLLNNKDYAQRVVALYKPSSLMRWPRGMGLLCQHKEGENEYYQQENDVFWPTNLLNCSNLQNTFIRTVQNCNRTDQGYLLNLPKCHEKQDRFALKVPFPFNKVLAFPVPEAGHQVRMTVNGAIAPTQTEEEGGWAHRITDYWWVLPSEAPAGSIVSFCTAKTNEVAMLRNLIAFL